MTQAAQTPLSPAQPGLTPWKLLQTYSSGEWEDFIVEWTEGFQPKYHQVIRMGGAGDKGRDVVAYLSDPTKPNAEWDNYQCKHYDHPLRPSDVWVELGKLCVYTHRGDYTIPRRYRFVAPRGVGPKLHDLLKKPEELKKQLIASWDKECKTAISDSEIIPLETGLLAHVEAFDFSIVWFVTHQELLNQHRDTRYWYQRFRVEPPSRPPPGKPSDEVLPHELHYVKCLLEAYGDNLKRPLTSSSELTNFPHLLKHFRHSRECFFSAEALARFSRDNFLPGAFDEVQNHIHAGVYDTTLVCHADGFHCVLKVAEVAMTLPLPDSELKPYIGPADRKGICHHLANNRRLTWIP